MAKLRMHSTKLKINKFTPEYLTGPYNIDLIADSLCISEYTKSDEIKTIETYNYRTATTFECYGYIECAAGDHLGLIKVEMNNIGAFVTTHVSSKHNLSEWEEDLKEDKTAYIAFEGDIMEYFGKEFKFKSVQSGGILVFYSSSHDVYARDKFQERNKKYTINFTVSSKNKLNGTLLNLFRMKFPGAVALSMSEDYVNIEFTITVDKYDSDRVYDLILGGLPAFHSADIIISAMDHTTGEFINNEYTVRGKMISGSLFNIYSLEDWYPVYVAGPRDRKIL
jgi:hypothetical protein